jgi:hypothetical protein
VIFILFIIFINDPIDILPPCINDVEPFYIRMKSPPRLAFLSCFVFLVDKSSSVSPTTQSSIFVRDRPTEQSCIGSSRSKELFSRYLRSELFLAEASASRIPDEAYSILVSRFVRGYEGNFNLDDSVFESILSGDTPIETIMRPALHADSSDSDTEWVGSDSTGHSYLLTQRRAVAAPIPSDDIIVSNAVADLVKMRDEIERTTPDDNWYTFLSDSVNTELYLVHNQVDQASACKTLQCRIWREVLRQLHYRVAIGFANEEWPDFYYFSLKVSPVLHGLVSEANRGPGRDDVPKCSMLVAAVAVPFAIEAGVTVGCWCIGRCIKWYRSRYETTTEAPTTTPEPPTTVDPSIGIRREQRRIFFQSANAYLDEIVKLVGSVPGSQSTEFEARIAETRKTVVKRVLQITSGMSKMSGGLDSEGVRFDISKAEKLALNVNELMTEPMTPISWEASMRSSIMQAVNELRTELLELLVQLV